MKILFVCTHNRCRSILAEAITNKNAGGNIVAYSAGSAPAGEVHPLTLKYLKECGYETADLKSQSWEEFATNAIDLVITVCDSAAQEACPLWIGKTLKVHWPIKDPSKTEGNDEDVETAFLHTIKLIENKVRALTETVNRKLTKNEMQLELKQIAEIN
ncbi:arsenate reductase ArsC [Aurantivibrio infirmus]